MGTTVNWLLRVCALLLLAMPAGSGGAWADRLAGDSVEVLYHPDDIRAAQASLQTARATVSGLRDRMPAGEKPVRIVLAHSYDEFRRYAGPYTQPGVGGIFIRDRDLIVLKAPRIQTAGADFSGILRHELIHLLVARNYNLANIPRWLNEGIAMLESDERRWDDHSVVAYTYLRGQLIPYDKLNLSVAAQGHEGDLGRAYAQSLSMTQYLMDRLGSERFWAMLRSLDERTFPEALRAELGESPLQFWHAWHDSLWKFALVFALVSGFSLFQLMALLVLVAYWRKRRRNRRLMRQWDEEEEDDIPYLFAHELEGQEAPYPWEEDDEEGRL
jgi:hypothetical protein